MVCEAKSLLASAGGVVLAYAVAAQSLLSARWAGLSYRRMPARTRIATPWGNSCLLFLEPERLVCGRVRRVVAVVLARVSKSLAPGRYAACWTGIAGVSPLVLTTKTGRSVGSER
jgi:hypothetical protein